MKDFNLLVSIVIVIAVTLSEIKQKIVMAKSPMKSLNKVFKKKKKTENKLIHLRWDAGEKCCQYYGHLYQG